MLQVLLEQLNLQHNLQDPEIQDGDRKLITKDRQLHPIQTEEQNQNEWVRDVLIITSNVPQKVLEKDSFINLELVQCKSASGHFFHISHRTGTDDHN